MEIPQIFIPDFIPLGAAMAMRVLLFRINKNYFAQASFMY
ncbi:hypothetical protein SAMN05421766_104630 [Zobellia uliginosa]|uniref:Photosystem I reaction center subunit VIII n=1 Tax=Zobellia uliginosa TaxID=143224 RepID=A0ABY1KX76_9FLAO|nr:hypothetical protein SAMN05421766_104630 [Zobellia uliginosa]